MPTSTRGPKRRKPAFPPSLPETGRSDSLTETASPTTSSIGVNGEAGSPNPSSPLTILSAQNIPTPRSTTSSHATDALCSREMVLWMLNDFVTCLYPLIPVIHRPSFRRSISANQDDVDADLLGLIISMCAAVVGAMPSKFTSYRNYIPPLPFETRQAFIDHAYTVLLTLRGPGYFDQISFKKFATSYLFDIAFFQIGSANRARIIEVECLQLGRMLNLHRITEYRGLNQIETQLRKKGFWLLFYSYVHGQVQNLRKDRLTFLDPTLLQSLDLESLMPLDVDDEAIFEDRVIPSLSSRPNLTTGYNLTSHVFWAAIESRASRYTEVAACSHCSGTRSSRARQITHIQSRLHDLSQALEEPAVPPELRQANVKPMPLSPDLASNTPGLLASQLGAVRGNLHITHLWLQSILLDQLEALLQEYTPHPHSSDGQSVPLPAHLATAETRWRVRETLCSQLISTLHSIPLPALEPNGLHFAFKVRDVAVGLLSCPFDPDHPASIRAVEFVREFTLLLSKLDSSEVVATTNLQTWVDTDRERGRRGAEEEHVGCEKTFGWV